MPYNLEANQYIDPNDPADQAFFATMSPVENDWFSRQAFIGDDPVDTIPKIHEMGAAVVDPESYVEGGQL